MKTLKKIKKILTVEQKSGNSSNKQGMKELFTRFYINAHNRKEEFQLLSTQEVDEFLYHQWEKPEEFKGQFPAPDFEQLYQSIDQKISKKSGILLHPVLKMAAAVTLLLTLGIAGYYGFKTYKQTQTTVVSTSSGEIKTFSLPDGSQLVLAENSKVSYPENFLNNRDVELEGKAFFKVMKNQTPFRVITDPLTIEVKGTSFSVANYKRSNDLEVLLVEGKILVADPASSFRMDLNPNERLVYQKQTGQYAKTAVDAKIQSQWQNGKINFDNSPLNQIAKELEKRFSKPIQVDKEVANYHFTFSVSTETLDETLQLIGTLAPIHYTLEKDTIRLSLQK